MTRFEKYKEYIQNKTCVVIGLGVSNIPLIDFLYGLGVKKISVKDGGGRTDRDKARVLSLCKKLLDDGKIISYTVGENYLDDLTGADIIFRTPGMRPDIQQLEEAVKNGAVLTSEMEEFLHLCVGKIIAVTGSDGKTTTTTLIYEMLKREYENTERKIYVGGNIGKPLLSEVFNIKSTDFAVLELSSFQLMGAKLNPLVSVVTNVSPNHLDWHKSYGEYVEAKKNIFRNASKSSVLVVNDDNEVTSAFEFEGKIRRFSKSNVPEVLENSNILVPGNYNLENFLAAEAAVRDFVKPQSVKYVAENFKGVPHRTEFVREFEGVKYYNSSIDSSPNRTVNTLSVFADKSVILLAGGKDKGIAYDAIGPAINKKVKAMVLVGPTSHLIAEASENAEGEKPEIVFVEDFEEAVKMCRLLASKGDVVLLSPASTSFDRFANFEERGEVFKRSVQAISE